MFCFVSASVQEAEKKFNFVLFYLICHQSLSIENIHPMIVSWKNLRENGRENKEEKSKERKKEGKQKIDLKSINYFYMILQTYLTYFPLFYIKIK